jgi:hypothetical protein
MSFSHRLILTTKWEDLPSESSVLHAKVVFYSTECDVKKMGKWKVAREPTLRKQNLEIIRVLFSYVMKCLL